MKSCTKNLSRAVSVCLIALGCGGGTESTPTMCLGSDVVAHERNNYSFSSSITLSPVTVASMSNLTFGWSGLTRSFLGHPLNPASDLGTALVMIWALPLSEFQSKLNADQLFTADLVVSPPLNLPLTGATSGELHDFLINGTAVTPDMFNVYFDAAMWTPANSTFVVAVQGGMDLGRDIRMLQAFHLDASSTTTHVEITNDSTKLSYSANLRSLARTGVPGGTSDLSLDWSQMTKNALGADFTENQITRVVVSHYTQTPAELEARFLDLERIATATYRADITAGSVLDFTTLKAENGASFPGIDDTGTWLVGLFCGNCRNPAPWYMTILEPCSM